MSRDSDPTDFGTLKVTAAKPAPVVSKKAPPATGLLGLTVNFGPRSSTFSLSVAVATTTPSLIYSRFPTIALPIARGTKHDFPDISAIRSRQAPSS